MPPDSPLIARPHAKGRQEFVQLSRSSALIQEIEHVDFRGALRLLAEKTGVELEESPGAGRQRELKKTIERLNLLAAHYFHHILLENPAGQRR